MRLRNGTPFPQNLKLGMNPALIVYQCWVVYIVDQAIVFRSVCFSIARSYVSFVYVYGLGCVTNFQVL